MTIIDMLEQMAENGHAPEEGCSLFGVGYDDAFAAIKKTYLLNRFERGKSNEKFIIGPFGSGKTHFLRQLLEMARNEGCFTSEINLNKDIDFTKNLIVYSEMAKEIRTPTRKEHGIKPLIESCIENIRIKAPDAQTADEIVNKWISGIDKYDFKLETFGRVIKYGLTAYQNNDDVIFNAACRWIEGEITNRDIAKKLSTSIVVRDEQNIFSKRLMLSLFQFIRYSGFRGTVIGLDESEQGFDVDRKKLYKILSMLQSGINAINDLEDGSALIVFALTPDITEKIDKYPALQQRLSDPAPGMEFPINPYSPKIDLTIRKDSLKELKMIGEKLVELLYSNYEISVDKRQVLNRVYEYAEKINSEEASTKSRRLMVKRTCAMLMGVYNNGRIIDIKEKPETDTFTPEKEV